MADLHVTDAIIVGAERDFGAAATHLEPVTRAVRHLDNEAAGATVMVSGLASQNGQLAVAFTTAGQCLARLAQNAAEAGQELADIDQALGRAVAEEGR